MCTPCNVDREVVRRRTVVVTLLRLCCRNNASASSNGSNRVARNSAATSAVGDRITNCASTIAATCRQCCRIAKDNRSARRIQREASLVRTCHAECCIDKSNCIRTVGKVAAANCIRANVLTRVTRNRPTQCLGANQVSAGDLIRQLRVWLSEHLCFVGGPHRDRTRVNSQVGAHISNGVVGIGQCPLSNRVRSNTFATCTTKRTAKCVTSNQCTRSNGVQQLWVGIAVVLACRSCRHRNRAINHRYRCRR